MNQNELILITVIIACAAVFAITYIAIHRAKKNASDIATLDKVSTGISYAQSIAAAIKPFLPNIADDVIDFTLSSAQKAVASVEAPYKAAIQTGAQADDNRRATANSLIKSALTLEGIADTPEIDKLIDTIIPLLVMALPKTHEAVPYSTLDISHTAGVQTPTV